MGGFKWKLLDVIMTKYRVMLIGIYLMRWAKLSGKTTLVANKNKVSACSGCKL